MLLDGLFLRVERYDFGLGDGQNNYTIDDDKRVVKISQSEYEEIKAFSYEIKSEEENVYLIQMKRVPSNIRSKYAQKLLAHYKGLSPAEQANFKSYIDSLEKFIQFYPPINDTSTNAVIQNPFEPVRKYIESKLDKAIIDAEEDPLKDTIAPGMNYVIYITETIQEIKSAWDDKRGDEDGISKVGFNSFVDEVSAKYINKYINSKH